MFDLTIPGLHVSRYSKINADCVHAIHLPALCLIVRGAKTVIVGPDTYQYDASRMLVFSIALPVAAQITRASFSEPYLALRLDFEPQRIAELVLKVFPHGLPTISERKAVYFTPVEAGIVNATTRLMECLSQPRDVELLAPLVKEEILIRLLRGPIGPRMAQMGFEESSVQRIAKAITWLHANFSQPNEDRRVGRNGEHEPFVFSRALQVSHFDEPAAISKSVAAPGGAPPHAFHDGRRRHSEPAGRLFECLAIQPRVQPFFRKCPH